MWTGSLTNKGIFKELFYIFVQILMMRIVFLQHFTQSKMLKSQEGFFYEHGTQNREFVLKIMAACFCTYTVVYMLSLAYLY